MRIIVRTCAGREKFIDYLRERIPEIEVCFDDDGGAFQNFLKALRMAGDDPVIHLEDDIILTKNFKRKAMQAISENPNSLVQFFSMRKADLTEGSRIDLGSKFLMAQCFYAPAFMSRGIHAYAATWGKRKTHATGLDTMVADFLRDNKMKYFLYVPSLVDHRVGKSAIDPRRSSRRQSLTFIDPDI